MLCYLLDGLACTLVLRTDVACNPSSDNITILSSIVSLDEVQTSFVSVGTSLGETIGKNYVFLAVRKHLLRIYTIHGCVCFAQTFGHTPYEL